MGWGWQPQGDSGPTTQPDLFCWVPRAMDATTFEIFSTFPPTVYQNDALTLQAAGLVPNATLLLRSRMVSLPAPGSLSK